jgi:hypothetical protein
MAYVPVAFIYIFNFAFSSCIGPLTWVYPVEIMNTAIRAKATALTTMAGKHKIPVASNEVAS